MIDKVHTALKHALDETGIEYSEPTQALNLQVGAQVIEKVLSSLRAQNRNRAGA